jgi:hypothetical protein
VSCFRREAAACAAAPVQSRLPQDWTAAITAPQQGFQSRFALKLQKSLASREAATVTLKGYFE